MEGGWDSDDTPPVPTLADIYWHYMSRAAEYGMFYARLCGWKENKMFYCENPACAKRAGMRRRFQDPRRGDSELAYCERYYCSPECELAIVEELERQAQYSRVVN